VNDDSTESKHRQVTIHERLGDLCIAFHQLQDELLSQADAEKGARLQQLATLLIVLSREHSDQVLGELFLSEHSNYNFTKPLYIAASLVELIQRYNRYAADAAIDDHRLEEMVIALGHNLGLLAYEKRVYESQEEFSVEEKRQLREHYP
jgi:hypothetical protein